MWLASLENDADLRRFLLELDRLVTSHEGSASSGALTDALQPHVGRLLESPGWLDERFRRADDPAKFAAFVLASEPAQRWTVMSMVIPPGASTPVHDHHTWAVIGMIEGIEEERFFERIDDGVAPQVARLRPETTRINKQGMISTLVPPREIHQIYNPGPGRSVSLHVYGGDIEKLDRHRYDLETHTMHSYRPTASR
jgi:predicted metal-dependent enzyme (double-stranded beta helix superfamily)